MKLLFMWKDPESSPPLLRPFLETMGWCVADEQQTAFVVYLFRYRSSSSLLRTIIPSSISKTPSYGLPEQVLIEALEVHDRVTPHYC
jgi:hypothetical protein